MSIRNNNKLGTARVKTKHDSFRAVSGISDRELQAIKNKRKGLERK